MSHWLDNTDNWVETYKRKMQNPHKDLRVNLDIAINRSSLPFMDVQACSLATAMVCNYPVLVLAIKKEIGNAVEGSAAVTVASKVQQHSVFIRSGLIDEGLFNQQDEDYAYVTPTKYYMYAFAVSLSLGNQTLIDYYKSKLLELGVSNQELADVARIASVVTATAGAQV